MVLGLRGLISLYLLLESLSFGIYLKFSIKILMFKFALLKDSLRRRLFAAFTVSFCIGTALQVLFEFENLQKTEVRC